MSYLQDYERHAYVGFVQRVIEKKIRDHVKNVHGLQNIEIDVCYCQSFSTRCMVYCAYVKGMRRCECGGLVKVALTLNCVMTCNVFVSIVEDLMNEENGEDDDE